MVVLLHGVPPLEETEAGPSKRHASCEGSAARPDDGAEDEEEKRPQEPVCPKCTYLKPGTRFKGDDALPTPPSDWLNPKAKLMVLMPLPLDRHTKGPHQQGGRVDRQCGDPRL